ncbi:VP1 [Thetapolyomavirus trebernacchii]|uniref:VP1 n=1 Tax=Thetapolyomavirus trebernacchii TaxID=2218588 RepID=A0A2U9K627_9POLY|nr:VP1 [Thetapolyomavirus trebernacchii]AWS21315.1 VP1 [Thetapolyomavirus trebernacchii]
MPVVKGGYEVLNIVADLNESERLDINCYLAPEAYTQAVGSNKSPKWLTSAIDLPKIPVAAKGNKIKIWECYKCSTGVLTGDPNHVNEIPSQSPYNGPSRSSWCVSGLPMEGFGKWPFPEAPPQPSILMKNDLYDSTDFTPNPWMENAKYYVSKQMGTQSYAAGDNNSSVVLLADADGFGIMCPQGSCFISALDFFTQYISGKTVFQCYQIPRYFKLYFRQRWVKSPVVLMDLFTQMVNQQVQGYAGETGNIEHVSLAWGKRDLVPGGLLGNTLNKLGAGTSTSTTMDTEEPPALPVKLAKSQVGSYKQPSASKIPPGVTITNK